MVTQQGRLLVVFANAQRHPQGVMALAARFMGGFLLPFCCLQKIGGVFFRGKGQQNHEIQKRDDLLGFSHGFCPVKYEGKFTAMMVPNTFPIFFVLVFPFGASKSELLGKLGQKQMAQNKGAWSLKRKPYSNLPVFKVMTHD